ncbi:MAG TPA: DNA polymerase III subunit alpha [Candidatus Borkfalkia excrementigallinarum]|uniref:DNA polymerase III subunit alpha n=1 Tax=Candidatus Borkfalkia excrementigallinarum TaxID=2838506 RepID=A0A9D1ZW24_9FIRM|nr:DNA polymerase III subunit alpha [Candidatus Borkfalkia excrementigallinarum]
MAEFVHLHLHTEYSLLDGACKVDDLVDHCVKNNIKAVAITDHGNMYATLYFAELCKKHNIQSIIGCEMYMTQDLHVKDNSGDFEHLILLAKNKKGYKNLVKLDSVAFVDGFYYKPRIDYKLLREHSEGLVCLSACLAGRIPKLLLRGDYEGAKKTAVELKEIFGEDFYIEIQDHGLEEQRRILPLLLQLAKELDIQPVATNDVHYINKEDWEMQDVLMCIQMKKTIDDPKRMKFETQEFYMKSAEEMAALFSYVPEAISNTLVIAEKCAEEPCFDLKDNGDPIKDKSLIPGYTPEDGSDPKDYLTKLTWEGLERRYGEITEEVKKRADYELGIILGMGFAEYYLIVMDFIQWSKNRGIPVGPGRGSGAASIVAYAIGITDIDPLKYDLFFERFLNPDRVTMPDFDVDFCNERRPETIEYVRQKYHPENVAQIVTFGTLASKAAIKDVGRVLRVPYSETDRVTKIMDGKSTISELLGRKIPGLQKKLEDPSLPEEKREDVRKSLDEQEKKKNNEFIELYQSDEQLHRVIDMALKLEGMPRNTSMHAAGVVICRKPIAEAVPLSRNGEDITTQFDMKEVESIGMLKMDFLALTTLTDIKKACDYILEDTGTVIDWDKIGYENKEAYGLISEGDTDAVFQLEQGGMKRFMKDLKPDCLEDIIAGVALYRPGPMAYIPTYIANKLNPGQVKYDTPLLEHILKVTYGVIIYQEQVMQIFQDLAGFSLGQADLVRRAMGKKNKAELMAQKDKFIFGNIEQGGNIEGAVARGVPKEVAEKIFGDMESFASYAFNKAHATCYAVLAYRTAYLKRFYPKEFLAAILNNRIEKIDEVSKYIVYLKEKNFLVLQPDVNKSKAYFSVQGEGVRFGLSALKGVGVGATQSIIDEREENGDFKSFPDLVYRCAPFLNKRMLEGLICAGAFDCFGVNRAQLLAVYDSVLDRANKIAKQKQSMQMSLFGDIIEDNVEDIKYPAISEMEMSEKLSKEKQVLGVYVSGHPFEKYVSSFKDCTFNCLMLQNYEEDEDGHRTYPDLTDGAPVTMGGIIGSYKRINTRSGSTMAFISVEDLYGNIECVAFPNVFDRIKSVVAADKIVRLSGKIQLDEEKAPVIILDKMQEYSETGAAEEAPSAESKPRKRQEHALWLNASALSEEEFDDFTSLFAHYMNGNTTVKIKRGGKLFKMSNINYCRGLRDELYLYLDDSDIVQV